MIDGLEGLPAIAGVVEKATNRALSATDEEKSRLGAIAHNSPEMQHAAHEYAKRVAIRETIVRKIYSGMARVLGIREEYFHGKFAEELAAKTANVPEDQLQAPPSSLAFQTMQGLGFSLDEPDLKEMYLNLLATATDKRSASRAHPAFADVIRQLSPDEADMLATILNQRSWPVAQIKTFASENSSSYSVDVSLRMDIVDDKTKLWISPELIDLWVTNWARLGLVDVDHDKWLAAEPYWDWLALNPLTANLEIVDSGNSPSIENRPIRAVSRGVMTVTTFGVAFGKAVTVIELPTAPS